MNRKRIVYIILLIIGVVFFAVGAITDVQIQSFNDFVATTNTKVFRLMKFSTEEYPKMKATLYLATGKNNPNLKLTDGSFDPNSVIQFDGKLQKDVKATVINKSLGETLDYYELDVEYTMDITADSAEKRTGDFHLVNDKGDDQKLSATIQNYYVAKIKALFINPNTSNSKLVKKDGKILLEAKASAQGVKGIYYLSTTSSAVDIDDTTVNSDGKIITQTETETTSQAFYLDFKETSSANDDPITRGVFTITGKNDLGVLVSKTVNNYSTPTDGTVNERVALTGFVDAGITWYNAKSYLNAAEFTNTFGTDPSELKITFTASTDTGMIKIIYLEDMTLVEEDVPKITNFTMTNISLKTFMESLKGISNTNIFVASQVNDSTVITKSNESGLTQTELESVKVNAKDGDSIKLEFTVDDESIFDKNGDTIADGAAKVEVVYNGTTYTAKYIGTVSGTHKTNWEVNIPSYVAGNANISFNVMDSMTTPNKSALTDKSVSLFNEPGLLDNTSFVANTLNPAGAEYSNYYNTTLTTTSKPLDALAYLVKFNYISSIVDPGGPIGTYADNAGNKWVTSLDGNFPFKDGGYDYNGTVYVINAAGAIKDITHDSTTNKAKFATSNISNVLSAIGIGVQHLYVDTVVPKVNNLELRKTADINVELNSGITSEMINGRVDADETISGVLVPKKPYKAGDSLSFGANITENNLAKIKFNNSDVANIFADTSLGTLIGTNYSKTGVAADLTGAGEGIDSSSISVYVYDKAGNITNNVSDINGVLTAQALILNKTYDDRAPSPLVTQRSGAPDIDWVIAPYKYTNDITLPLVKQDSANGVPLSVVSVAALGIYGDVRTAIGTLGAYGYPVQSNQLNSIGDISTYSYSGVKVVANDSIVLDTEINDSLTLWNKTGVVSASTNHYSLNLTNFFSSIKDIIGINEFEIAVSGGVSDLKVNGSITSGPYPLVGAAYSITPIASNLTTVSGGTYELTFTTALRGDINFVIRVRDRLENSKDITYSVYIPQSVTIIGKKVGSDLQISSKLSNINSVRIESRLER